MEVVFRECGRASDQRPVSVYAFRLSAAPQAVGGSMLGTMCTSIVTGASLHVARLWRSKFRSTQPSVNVIAQLAINSLRPKTSPALAGR